LPGSSISHDAHGGEDFFERMVRCTESSLKKILDVAKPAYEELLTVFTEVDEVLNSRPLTYVYSDEVEEPFTPSH